MVVFIFSMRLRALAAATCVATVCLAPTVAVAHSPIPGIEGFYAGLLHPLSNVAQLLALLALAVMLGLGFRQSAASSLAALAFGVLIGIVLGQLALTADWLQVGLLVTAVAAAATSALFPVLPIVVAALFALVVGILVGIASTPDPGPLRATLITLAGSFVGANLLVLYVGGGVDWIREKYTEHWVQVGIRVVAAWICAISVLMTALAFASP